MIPHLLLFKEWLKRKNAKMRKLYDILKIELEEGVG